MKHQDTKKISNQTSPNSLTDGDILTERRLSRRSFVAVSGAVLAGGAMAILTEGRALAMDGTPSAKSTQKGASDPDQKKKVPASDPDHKKNVPASDPDHKKAAPASDPDHKKPAPSPDPDHRRR